MKKKCYYGAAPKFPADLRREWCLWNPLLALLAATGCAAYREPVRLGRRRSIINGFIERGWFPTQRLGAESIPWSAFYFQVGWW